MMKRNLKQALVKAVILGLVLVGRSGLAQETSQPDEIIPPSPTASGLGKYGEIPVSHFTGTAGVSVPIYDLPARGMSVPISLSYHTSGVKVDESASWVGMGWSLNAGGTITRSVKGLPDEGTNGLLSLYRQSEGLPLFNSNHVELEGNDPRYQATQEILNGTRDSEPDIFYYNFFGSSGQMVFDEEGNCTTVPYDNIQFVKTLSITNQEEWILKDGGGNTYYFGSNDGSGDGIEFARSNTSDPDPSDPPSAWYLTKIITARGGEITFQYVEKNLTTESESPDTYTWYLPVPLDPVTPLTPEWSNFLRTQTRYSGKSILRSISSEFGSVVISTSDDREDVQGGVLASEITAYDHTGVLVRSWDLAYGYESSHRERIYLRSIQERGVRGQSIKPPHTFDYYDHPSRELPPRFSKNQDYWGYFNGANNTHLVGPAYTTDPFTRELMFPPPITFADRDSRLAYTRIGALRRINYPTGGYTQLEYDINQATPPRNFLTDPVRKTLISARGETQVLEFDVDILQRISLQISFEDYREDDNFPRPLVTLEGLVGEEWTELRPPWRPSYPSLEDESYSDNIDLGVGQYRLVATSESCTTPPCNTPLGLPDDLYNTIVDLQYFNSPNGTSTINVGGLRVSRIVSHDGSEETNIKRYDYKPGILVSTPEYAYSFTKQFCVNQNEFPRCIEWNTTTGYKISSQSYAILGTSNGSHVIYPEVTEIHGDNAENGTIDYVYRVDGLGSGSMYKINAPFVLSDFEDYLNGQLVGQSVRRDDGQMLQQVANDYNDGGREVNYSSIGGMKILQNFIPDGESNPSGISFYYDRYEVQSKWVFMRSSSTRTYDPSDKKKYVETYTEYEYDPVHTNPTTTTTIKSNGRATIVRTLYPTDYEGADNPILTDMRTSYHMHDLPIEIIQKEGNATYDPITQQWSVSDLVTLGGQYTQYNRTPGGHILPGTQYQLETASRISDLGPLPLQPSSGNPEGQFDPVYYSDQPVVANRYDAQGNIIQRTTRDGVPTSFVWGYGGRYPVARILGLTFEELESALGIGFSPAGDVLSQAQIDLIKDDFPQAQVATYTFRPGFGISSMTDPNGLVTRYEYDQGGRLQYIIDHEDHILQQVEYHYANQNND